MATVVRSELELVLRHYFVSCPLYGDLLSHVDRPELVFKLSPNVDSLIMQMVAMVAGERIEEIRYPLDWWQAVKERFSPALLLKRWPVKYHIWRLDMHYPGAYQRARSGGVYRLYSNQRSPGFPHYEDADKDEE